MIVPLYLKYTNKRAYNSYLRIKVLAEKLKTLQAKHLKSSDTRQQLKYEQAKFYALCGKRVRWTDDLIVMWHKETFPQADLVSQRAKLLEELCEALIVSPNDNDSFIEEIADVYIVCITLKKRYNNSEGEKILEKIKGSRSKKKILLSIDNKMTVNVNRVFKLSNGVYHH